MEQQHVAGKTLKCPNPAPEARNRTGNGHWELPSELGIGTGNQYTCCWNWGHYWERGLARPGSGKSDQCGELGTLLGTGIQHCPGTKTWDHQEMGPSPSWEMGNLSG